MEMLRIEHVSKTFGTKQVIEDLNFSVPEHSIFGFIGQNGAGKTTTMKMILGLHRIDSGEIFVNDEKVCFGENRTNQYIGYLPDVPEFYDFMNPMEYLMFCGEITGMERRACRERAVELLRLVSLETSDARIKGFSRGMKQRLGIAQALLNSPKLLICDEPTSALDPVGRKEILDILSQVRMETTVIFSTHILSDVERICDEVAFLHNGKLAMQGTIEELRGLNKGGGLEIDFLNSEEAEWFMTQIPGGLSYGSGNTKVKYSNKTEQDMINIMELLSKHHIPVQKLEMLEPTLEDLFMEVIGR